MNPNSAQNNCTQIVCEPLPSLFKKLWALYFLRSSSCFVFNLSMTLFLLHRKMWIASQIILDDKKLIPVPKYIAFWVPLERLFLLV
jgi:hypothetical protein